MNEHIDLTQILKDCPEGFQLYSPIFGIVYVKRVTPYNVHVSTIREIEAIFRKNGKYFTEYEDSECMLFPSNDQRDWGKFTASWYKKEKFDPKTLQPFDKVLVRDLYPCSWRCTFYSHTKEDGNPFKYITDNSIYEFCIPYNDDTKHLVGTNEEAPEYYRYWDD